MKYYVVILLIINVSFSSFGNANSMHQDQSCNKYFERGIKAFKDRARNADDWLASSEYIDRAIYFFKKSLDCSKHKQESGYYLLRSLHFKAMYTGLPDEEMKSLYNEAKNIGEELIEEYPMDVGIKVWYLASLGKWIQFYGIFRAAYEGLGPKTKRIAETIVELNPHYENGIGYRILGIIYYQAPYIPVILTWPDDEKGINYCKKALSINPDNIGNLLFMGKILYLDKQYEEAKYYFRKCIEQEPRKDYLIMERFDQMKAREFLSKIRSESEGK